MNLTKEQMSRYKRNILLDDVGISGQKKLLNSSVLIIGVGGLGSPAALYLAAAGVGTIGLVDFDTVDITNLQRQIIHNTSDIEKAKVESAATKMRAVNPDVIVRTYQKMLDENNAVSIMKEYDFIIDATDNFKSKFLINDAALIANKPFSHAGILCFKGQLMTVKPYETACYRCVFDFVKSHENSNSSNKETGVLGVTAGVIGSLQATEAIKYIISKGPLLTNTLFIYDSLNMNFNKIKLEKNPNCKCSKRYNYS